MTTMPVTTMVTFEMSNVLIFTFQCSSRTQFTSPRYVWNPLCPELPAVSHGITSSCALHEDNEPYPSSACLRAITGDFPWIPRAGKDAARLAFAPKSLPYHLGMSFPNLERMAISLAMLRPLLTSCGHRGYALGTSSNRNTSWFYSHSDSGFIWVIAKLVLKIY